MSENKFNILTRINTKDGSSTLEIDGIEETYHSRHGAILEAYHVFILNGLQTQTSKKNTNIYIFEMGFGTGLNALLTFLFAKKENLRIHYHTIDTLPLKYETIKELNYSSSIIKNLSSNNFEADDIDKYLKLLIETPWEVEVKISPFFSIIKNKSSLNNAQLKKYDLIYFDAFGPKTQPELWELDCFNKIAYHCNPKAHLTTYCAQGAFRRNLKSCGFKVEKVAGPPGKREMTIGEFQRIP